MLSEAEEVRPFAIILPLQARNGDRCSISDILPKASVLLLVDKFFDDVNGPIVITDDDSSFDEAQEGNMGGIFEIEVAGGDSVLHPAVHKGGE